MLHHRYLAMLLVLALAGLFTGSGILGQTRQRSDLNPVTFRQAPAHEPVVLVENGVPRAAIVLMDVKMTDQMQYALRELQECIELTTGAKMPVRRYTGPGPAIIIGDCQEAARMGLMGENMPVEGFAIKTAKNRVFIVGNQQRIHDNPLESSVWPDSNGPAWGVAEFLERFVGVRWFFQTEQGGRSLVKKNSLVIDPVWIEDAPVFRKRSLWPDPGPTLLRSADSWPVQLRVARPVWHEVEEYVKNRPEVFELRSDGTRNFDMICYSHPRTLETYLENLEAAFDRGDEIRRSDGNYIALSDNAITVSPRDYWLACRCELCRKLWDESGGLNGTASRILADFVARLAPEVKKRWPDKAIIYLPYLNYTVAPDGYKFPGNVEVQLCGMPGIAQYKEPAIAVSEQANIDKWIQITGRKIQNWHYSCWPADRIRAPYQYPHVLKEFYQKNRDKSVGSFINGGFGEWPSQHISFYCWLKVLWNPDFDVDAAIDQYCGRMYGPAADTMRELVRLQIDGWEKSRWPGGVLSLGALYEQSYPRETVLRMKALLERARTEAGDDKLIQQRLDYYSTPFAGFFREFEWVTERKGFRGVVAKKVAESPLIDGRLDEPVWQMAPETTLVNQNGQQEAGPSYPTRVKAVWTPQGITLGFWLSEPPAYEPAVHDNVEFYLNVTGTRLGEYYRFIINPTGALSDAKSEHHAGPGWLSLADGVPVDDEKGEGPAWNAQGLKSQAHIGADFWSLEVYLPYSAFPEAKVPQPDMMWFGQFCRNRPLTSTTWEVQRLNYKLGGSRHSRNPEDWGDIRFVE